MNLCRLLALDDLVADARYATNSARVLNRAVLETEIADALLSWRCADLIRRMCECGVPGGPINRVDQAFADPHVRARHIVERHLNENGVEIPFTRFPSLLSATPAQIRSVPPALGAHTREVLTDWAEMSKEDIEQLEEEAVTPRYVTKAGSARKTAT